MDEIEVINALKNVVGLSTVKVSVFTVKSSIFAY